MTIYFYMSCEYYEKIFGIVSSAYLVHYLKQYESETCVSQNLFWTFFAQFYLGNWIVIINPLLWQTYLYFRHLTDFFISFFKLSSCFQIVFSRLGQISKILFHKRDQLKNLSRLFPWHYHINIMVLSHHSIAVVIGPWNLKATHKTFEILLLECVLFSS